MTFAVDARKFREGMVIVMKEKIFALCDSEETYAYKMADYIAEKVKMPYEMHLFTRPEELERFAAQKKIEILLIAEHALRMIKEMSVRQNVQQIFILQETGQEREDGFTYIDKYQSPEEVVRALLESIADSSGWARQMAQTKEGAKMIGIYSPIKRCLQTPFAMTLGQILAKEHRVLYLNFECYSGLRQMLNREFATDMMDVMYYFRYAKDKLAVRMPSLVQSLNGMDFIPPMQSTLDMCEIEGVQWSNFCKEIADVGEYEYLILDLDDNMRGLFDLLRSCIRVYTIIKDDRAACAKLTQYEHVLRFHELEDVADKTVKCKFPVFEKIPADIGMMTHGDLANYVRAIIKEDLYGE